MPGFPTVVGPSPFPAAGRRARLRRRRGRSADAAAGALYPATIHDFDGDGTSDFALSSGTVYAAYRREGMVRWSVSNSGPGGKLGPSVMAVRDRLDRWIQARRIWNQHTYHVTNVGEDGTIPRSEAPSWRMLNTFRTNAQIEDGGVCRPRPEG